MYFDCEHDIVDFSKSQQLVKGTGTTYVCDVASVFCSSPRRQKCPASILINLKGLSPASFQPIIDLFRLGVKNRTPFVCGLIQLSVYVAHIVTM